MSPVVSNLIIVLILAVVLFFAVKSSIPHFKGQGACCGGAGKDVRVKVKKLETVSCTKVVKIEGMHCEHCYSRVHNALNSLEGISAKVNGKRGEAVVMFEKEPDEELIRKTVTNLDYTVVSIEDKR